MARTVKDIQRGDTRYLVLTADTASEMDSLMEKACNKGWSEYQEGVDPVSGKISAWLLKPAEPAMT